MTIEYSVVIWEMKLTIRFSQVFSGDMLLSRWQELWEIEERAKQEAMDLFLLRIQMTFLMLSS